MNRPVCAVTFPDGCVVTYSHPDGDIYPRADLVPAMDGHVHNDPDDSAIAHVIGRAFLEALRRTAYEPQEVPA